MSDYMFMLESHLTPSQAKVVAAVEDAARTQDIPVFLTGGAMRDMMGGFPITDLDFTLLGDPLPVSRVVTRNTGAKVLATDTVRKSIEIRFPSGVTAELAMARTERYPKPGGKPKIEPAPIHEDLLRRDFTINSIALSLHPASRGLLLDPTNGLADLEHRELRTNSHYAFYDDPARLIRLVRFRVRLGFVVDERTAQQYENARHAGMERHIGAASLFAELRHIAAQVNGGEVVAALDREKLMDLYSPALRGTKLNLATLGKLQKARQMVPFGLSIVDDHLSLFLYFLTEKLTQREKSELARNLGLPKTVLSAWKRLQPDARKLERAVRSPKLRRPSEVYDTLRTVPGEQVLFLYLHSAQRLVHDRIRNYLQKYLLAASEVTDKDVAAEGFQPGTRAFQRAREGMITARLDGRKWRPEDEKPQPTPRSKGRKTVSKAASKTPRKQTTAKKTGGSRRAPAKQPRTRKVTRRTTKRAAG